MSTPTSTPPPPTAIDNYFARFRAFNYDPAAPAASEFQRLCEQKRWRQRGVGYTKKGEEERTKFNAAFAEEFAEKFGYLEEDGKEDKKQKWMYLAQVLELDPLPASLTQFRKMMAGIWVNIYDVLQEEKVGGTVKRFENLRDLAKYSKKNKRIYRLDDAKGGALKFLLKPIIRGVRHRADYDHGGVDLANVFGQMAI